MPHPDASGQIGQNHGLQNLAPTSFALGPRLRQVLLCPCRPQVTIVLPAFARNYFADGQKEKKILPILKSHKSRFRQTFVLRSREISAAYLVGCIAKAFGLTQLEAEAMHSRELKARDSIGGKRGHSEIL